MSGPKLVAEGAPAEEQIVLGWMIDIHLIRLRLPPDKYEAWTRELTALRSGHVITYEGADSLVGKLNHTAFLIPLARHFLTRLRGLIDRDTSLSDNKLQSRDTSDSTPRSGSVFCSSPRKESR